ncbi:hypothetical protein AYO21_11796 [Fonsecaea monophora]|uniref:Uncharacterized protein n=1 Tax=Fonsecaea monophora TaxID=254056 RepID=A0A177ERX2_9EURO|nr:hypothetical protein AYO21_11796 [Fonsecaea monophora]KAH0841155.1 hypothetical protein FOPE_06359 [Fonsecaea pedrosoi]OAG34050.1 hypothetical protein AYO21_11796 [Fonsecaea monophora]
MSSHRSLHLTREFSPIGDRLGPFPSVFLKREDLLSTTFIDPPRPSTSPSPPTSGLPHLIEDSHIMFSRPTDSSTRRRALEEDDEVTVNNLGGFFSRDKQHIEISDSDFEPKGEDDNDDDDEEETVQPRSSKYDVIPPARPFVQVTTTTTYSTPRRSARVQPASPVNTKSSTSTTPRTSTKSRFSGRSGHIRADPLSEESPFKQVTTTAEDELDKNNLDDTAEPVFAERNLRKRTVKQTNPYKFDKYKYQLSVKTGHEASSKKVENAIREAIRVNEKQPITKLPTTERKITGKRRRASSPPAGIDLDNTFDPARTTLRVRLDGFQGGAATPITLSECNNNDRLIEFIHKSWEWKFQGLDFSHAIVSFPWLSNRSTILLRPGLDESFEHMMVEIQNAPIWRDGAQGRCDVEVTVHLY